MIHAFLTDGLDPERREQFDRTLEETGPAADEKAKAKREREAMARLMNLPRG